MLYSKHVNLFQFANSVLEKAPESTQDTQDNLTLDFPNGNQYSGQIYKGALHGRGTYYWKNGLLVYAGDFKENRMSGKGVLSWSNGATYEGQVQNNQRNGYGRFTSASGAVYEGEWKDGKFHGKGTLAFQTQNGNFKYFGEWKNGLKDGKGLMQYPSGNYYQGEWKENRKEGQGKFIWADLKQEYQGQWKDDKPHGQGKHTWTVELKTPFATPFDNFYQGEWVNGKRNGNGIFQYSSGSKYQGSFANDMKNGHGTLMSETGYEFTGNWRNDMPEKDSLSQYEFDWRFKSIEDPTTLRELNILYKRAEKQVELVYNFLLKSEKKQNMNGLFSQFTLFYWSLTVFNVYDKLTATPDKIMSSFKPIVNLPFSEWQNNPFAPVLSSNFIGWIQHLSSFYNESLIPEDELDKYLSIEAKKAAYFLKNHFIPYSQTISQHEIFMSRVGSHVNELYSLYSSKNTSLRDFCIHFKKSSKIKLNFSVEQFIAVCTRTLSFVPISELNFLDYQPNFIEFCVLLENFAQTLEKDLSTLL